MSKDIKMTSDSNMAQKRFELENEIIEESQLFEVN